MIEIVKNALAEVWSTRIKNVYLAGSICSERHLQAELYSNLLKHLTELLSRPNLRLWVEPKITGPPKITLTIKDLVPDLMITKDNVVICIIELKYVPHGYPESRNDMKKLGEYDNPDHKIYLGVKPETGQWNEQVYSISKDVILCSAVIANEGAEALDPIAYLEKDKGNLRGKNLLLLFGSVSVNNIRFYALGCDNSNLSNEAALLGAIITQKESHELVFTELSGEEFKSLKNQLVFKYAKQLFNQDQPVDILTIQSLINEYGSDDICRNWYIELPTNVGMDEQDIAAMIAPLKN